jgi:hypothetical protein
MKYEVLFNFISPVTGRLCIPEDYILIGDGQGFSMPSPILIDIRLDLINLRRDVNDIFDTSFIIGFPDIDFPNAQVLSKLDDGFMYNTKGIVSTKATIPVTSLPDLTDKHLWIGDSNNRPVEKQRIEIDNLPTFFTVNPLSLGGAYNLWTGSANPLKLGEPTTTLAIQRCNLPDLTVGKFWLGKSVSINEDPFNFGSNRPVEVDKLPVDNMADLTKGHFWIGDGNNRPQDTGLLYKNLIIGTQDNELGFRETIYHENLPDLTKGRFWMGDGNNRPQDTGLLFKNVIIGTQDNELGFREKIYNDNLPDLTFKAIWRGNATNRPEESQSLTTLELKVTNIEDVLIPGLEAEIAALEAEIVAIQAEITVIQGQITVLEGAVAILQGQILVIQGQIAAINQRIDNLRLNNIPADGDVSFYNFKLINLADPVNQTDGVNLRTLISYINNVPTTIELTGDVTGSGNTGTPISTTLQLTLDQIKIAQNTVNLNDQKIINLKSDDVEQKDALNAKFLWDLMHDQVGVVWV